MGRLNKILDIHKKATIKQKIGRAINSLGLTAQTTLALIEAKSTNPINGYWVYVISIALLQWLGLTIMDIYGQNNTGSDQGIASESQG